MNGFSSGFGLMRGQNVAPCIENDVVTSSLWIRIRCRMPALVSKSLQLGRIFLSFLTCSTIRQGSIQPFEP